MKYFVAAVALSVIALNANAELHKWIDADGVVHYSDTVPPDIQTTDTTTITSIAGKAQANAPAGFTQKSIADRDADWKKAQQEKEEAAKKQAEKDKQAETKKNNCAAAQENKRVLENAPRISSYDDKGEQIFMDDAARAQKLEEANKVISDNCN